MNKSNSLIKSIFSFSVGSWLQAIVAFVSIPIITRFFTPDEYGKINMFILAVGIGVILVDLSMKQSYIRFFNEFSNKRELLTRCISVSLIVFFILIIALYIFNNQISLYLFGEENTIAILLLLPAMIIGSIILSYQQTYYRMSNRPGRFIILGLLIAVTNNLVMIIAAFHKANYENAIIYTTIGVIFLAFIYRAFNKETFYIYKPTFNFKKSKTLIIYALPLVPVLLIGLLNSSVLRLFLKDYVSYFAVGVFIATASLANVLSLVRTGFTTYWTPYMFENYNSEIKLIRKTHSVITFVLVSFSLTLILIQDLIFSVLGEEYRIGSEIFGLMLVYPVLFTISETTCYGIYIAKKNHLQLYATIISFATTIILGILLIPYIGLLGAAVTSAISGLVLFSFRTYWGQKQYKSVEKFWRTVLAVCILFLVSLCSYFINDLERISLTLISLTFLFIIYRDVLRYTFSFVKDIYMERFR